ncbi:MAG TPA: citrate synthase [Polyangiaceae bacterium]|jgi:citrate synthase|nr:citrate synthase [Polyangiaceae bacterium]
MNGLEGMWVGDTALSDIDGERGELVVVGVPLDRLAAAGFEAACALLWDGALPHEQRLAELRAALGTARAQAYERLGEAALDLADAMDALRASVARISSTAEAVSLTGALAVIAAAWIRRMQGLAPVAPDVRRDHAADYLCMIRGAPVPASHAAAMSTYLATVSEHGMNASTFAARVVASTGADTVSAVVAGICALKGPLHGGAPGPVLDMLDAIGNPERAEPWLRAELAAGRRIMGMGHRVYRRRDPRAAVLERAIADLAANERLTLAHAVEHAAEQLLNERYPQRGLRANVEFYTAVLLEALGIPRAALTATFAVARVAGWCAHIDEQRRTGRLIRPLMRYVGPTDRGAVAHHSLL